MKHLTLSVITTTILISVNATAQQGSVLLLGNLGGANSSTENSVSNSKSFHITLNGGVGYQAGKHIALGIQGGYQYASSSNQSTFGGAIQTDKTTSRQYGMAVFCRSTYYIGNRLFVYLHGDIGGNNSRSQENNYGIITNGSATTVYGADLQPAAGLFLYRKLALSLGIGGINYRYSKMSGTTHNSLTYNIGQSFTIGISDNIIRPRHRATDKQHS